MFVCARFHTRANLYETVLALWKEDFIFRVFSKYHFSDLEWITAFSYIMEDKKCCRPRGKNWCVRTERKKNSVWRCGVYTIAAALSGMLFIREWLMMVFKNCGHYSKTVWKIIFFESIYKYDEEREEKKVYKSDALMCAKSACALIVHIDKLERNRREKNSGWSCQ